MGNSTKKRDTLKGYFESNMVPTQDNFSELIDGTVNKTDDKIFSSPDGDKQVIILGEYDKEDKALLNVHGSEGQTVISATAGSKTPVFTLSGTQMEVTPDSTFKGSVSAASVSADGDITATGNMEAEELIANGKVTASNGMTLSVGTEPYIEASNETVAVGQNMTAAGDVVVFGKISAGSDEMVDDKAVISVKVTEHEAALSVKRDEQTVLHMDNEGRLGIGLGDDDDVARARVHVFNYKGESGTDLIRATPHSNSNHFIVNSSGQVGVRTAAELYDLQVADSMRVGTEKSEDRLVIDKDGVGINTNDPGADLGIQSKKEDALKITRESKELLKVSKDGVSTENSVHSDMEITVGDIHDKDKTTLNDNLKLKGTLTTGGSATINGAAEVTGSAVVRGALQAGNSALGETSVAGNAAVTGELSVGLDAEMAKDLSVGNMMTTKTASVKENLYVSGKSTLAKGAVIGAKVLEQEKDSLLSLEAEALVHVRPDSNTKTTMIVDNAAAPGTPAVLVKEGKVDINTGNSEGEFSVEGRSSLKGELKVNENIYANSTQIVFTESETEGPSFAVEKSDDDGIHTSLAVNGGQVGVGTSAPDADLTVAGKVHITGELDVDAHAVISSVTVENETVLEDNLTVNADADINGKADVEDSLNVSVEEFQKCDARLHVAQKKNDDVALRVENYVDATAAASIARKTGNRPQAAFIVKGDKVGIGTNDPHKHLDVHGNAEIDGSVDISGELRASGNVHVVESGVFVDKNVGISVEYGDTEARLHINAAADQTPFIVDEGKDRTLIINDGKMGLGTGAPEKTLDVVGNARISKEAIVDENLTVGENLEVLHDATVGHNLKVTEDVEIGQKLDVGDDVTVGDDLTVREKTVMEGSVFVGTKGIIPESAEHKSQFYIADTKFNEALRIEYAEKDEPKEVIVAKKGKLGIGTEEPSEKLDVEGGAVISNGLVIKGKHWDNIDEDVESLSVHGNVRISDNLTADGSLTVNSRTKLQSDLIVKGDVSAEDDLAIGEDLTVNGFTDIQGVRVNKDAIITGSTKIGDSLSVETTLKVDGAVALGDDLVVAGGVTSGTTESKAHMHVVSQDRMIPFILEQYDGAQKTTALKVDEKGNFGIGTSRPDAKLEVEGNAFINGPAVIKGDMASDSLKTEYVEMRKSFVLGAGPEIKEISTENDLGGLSPSDNFLPTQKAVKAYIDEVSTTFGKYGQVITVNSQDDFNDLFNSSSTGVTILPENATILLLPLKDSYDSGKEVPAYELRNTVQVKSGVSIKGFNAETTRVVKDKGNIRFEMIGSSANKVRNVHFEGWTFDGCGLEGDFDGGAVLLQHAEECKINCHLVNHYTNGHGGAIFGDIARKIEALNIRDCKAKSSEGGSEKQKSRGGAAVGLTDSIINAEGCSADFGGAVVNCTRSVVTAVRCHAYNSGGGAYRTGRLKLIAIGCTAAKYGGGACYCSDLMCEGFWTDNDAKQGGPNIYAANHLTGPNKELHYWKGDYIGRRIENTRDTSVWRCDNE